MKTLMITAPTSNTGKTTITLGLLRHLKNRGLNVTGFKTGPDYIDPLYHQVACGNRSGNLDMHMMGEAGIFDSIKISKNDYGIIEGAMGYFDGTHNTYENSSYDISRHLDVPAILVYEPKGEMFSAIPKIKGMVDFSNGQIKGVIFNKTSFKMYELLKEQVERYIGIKVLGYVPKNDEFKLESRYLGLLQPHENIDLDEKINSISDEIGKTIDIDGLIGIMKEIDYGEYSYPNRTNISIAIAKDEAFNFYYTEDIKILDSCTDIKYFSPLKDKEPPNVDLLYIGGGYPELYKEKLSENKPMLNAIKAHAEKGKFIYAEGGGLMYLSEEIDGYGMCGVLDAKTVMTDKTQRFGYTNVELKEDCNLGKKGDKLRGKEFHKSKVESELDNIFILTKPGKVDLWECGYKYKNVIASYTHLNFVGNRLVLENLLASIKGEV